ncbi:MAG: hypothetical protein MR865_05430 [Bacteroidales bacterium]|nr:hypothetical protein [Bacteroidales bacterium]MDD7604671.1 hypothetical protein [Bacteroidales bacterium]MDD7760490.1 hypothetical protein [Bacteroidales bacterium]MDY5893503.1 hypothetical protein [Candidatus Limisoma sp.]
MRNLIIICISMLLVGVSSCIEDDFATGSSDLPEFSVDTLSFDTVFTGEVTATKRFLVYNRHKKQLNIERISFAGAPEGAKFYMNVDGRSGEEFSNVEVRGEDSIYVFVEARVDVNSSTTPFDVFDYLRFVTNGVEQTVVVRAAGQNANTVRNLHITENTTLSDPRPYRVMDSLVVEEGATLTIPAGKTIYFHDKALLKIRGTLIADGTTGSDVVLRGDRLDKVAGSIPFDLMSGQWGGVVIERGSFDNTLRHVYMQGSSMGVVVDSCGVTDRRKLYLYNSVLHNSSGSLLTAAHSWIDADGCEFSDCRYGVVDLTGGRYTFNNCTFANYYLFDAIMSPILTLWYVLPADKTYDNPLMQAEFNNCIVYGNCSDINEGDLTGSDVTLHNCLLRAEGTNDANFIDCLWGKDPCFYTVREDYYFDYRLRNESEAIGVGSAERVPQAARTDYYGNERLQERGVDIGAYVWIEQKEEEK